MASIWLMLIFQLATTAVGEWSDTFKRQPCYEVPLKDRMPLSLDNFIALIERYEEDNYNTEPEDVANAILNRYRQNGVIFDPNGNEEMQQQWVVAQTEEWGKQELDDMLIEPYLKVPEDLFIPREECSLHMMISHSIDQYPHDGVDYIWQNGYNYRKSRSVNAYKIDYDLADHPIENGVVQTNYGPIALGVLLQGIVDMRSQSTPSVEDLFSEGITDDMPDEMLDVKINSLYGVTVSGEVAQQALVSALDSDTSANDDIPEGRFGNSTACPRLFSLAETEFSYMSRAEIFASVDALIIATAVNDISSSQRLRLSHILRMYYGDHGLFSRDIRGCNRFINYKSLDREKIKNEALNYMYAYQYYIQQWRDYVKSNKGDFEKIEETFTKLRDDAFDALETFMASYSFTDQGIVRCDAYESGNTIAETTVDLVAIFTPVGDETAIQKQMDYIALTAREVGVGIHRSRVAVLNSKNNYWESTMSNYSNVADWACNSTTKDVNSGGSSSQDYRDILQELSKYYSYFYTQLLKDSEATGKHSQVLMWNLPNSFTGNREDAEEAYDEFISRYPDVSVIFVGSDDDAAQYLVGRDEEADLDEYFISNDKDYPEQIALEIVKLIHKTHRMFVYPGCNENDTSSDNNNNNYNDDDETYYNSKNEGSHVYTSYVTPNYTTFIRIPPRNYIFSEVLKLKFEDDDVNVCVSRENRWPTSKTAAEGECGAASIEFEFTELCGRYVNACSPIYIGVTGNSESRQFCSDDDCQFPNQIEFRMTHEGMTCGSFMAHPAMFIYILAVLVLFWRQGN